MSDIGVAGKVEVRLTRIAGFVIVRGMITKGLRDLWRASPFKPFDIHLADGRKFHVPHPDFLFISPRGETIVLVEADETPHTISPVLVVSASPTKKRAASRKTR